MAATALTDPNLRPHGLGAIVRRVVTVTVLGAAVAALVLAVPTLGPVRHALGSIDPWWALAAVLLEVASCVSFVPLFGAFFDTVPARVARRVAWIEEGSGALLPGGGVTSYALGGVFLHRAGMRIRQIVIRSGGLFWLTTAVNALALIVGALMLLLGVAPGPADFLHAGLPLVIVVPLTLTLAAAPWLVRADSSTRVGRAWRLSVVAGIADAWRAARHPDWRLTWAFGYLVFDIAVLYCLFRGLGYPISWAVLVLAYLIGYLATIIPIPGGIGVLEGGLVGTLVLYGAPAAKSVAAVLVYQAIALWIPSLGGLIAWGDLTLRLPRTRSTAPQSDRREAAAPDAPQRTGFASCHSHACAGTAREPGSTRSGRPPARDYTWAAVGAAVPRGNRTPRRSSRGITSAAKYSSSEM